MGNRVNNKLLLTALGAGAFFAARAILRQVNTYSFRDRVVLITGGSRGLGLLIARELAREGARLAICARDEDELHRAQEELSQRAEVIGMPDLPTTGRELADRAELAARTHEILQRE